ncbi:1-phosphofructokinase [Streptomyces sp. L-9-10]|uniref:1-phosphofructokinase family hexose kinase n=1 Tax=Streptomyces sp. L-9-10 TaxID=1478131 RepID=UPI0010D89DFF|nr:1-phosphofructokinase [Streptomyces sp. L-9-10]
MSAVILTVTLNTALDVTYVVDSMVPRTSHRVREVHERAGGKGVNVARVLNALGHPSVVTGFWGGTTGYRLREELLDVGLTDELVPIAADSRRTLTVVSREEGDATVFNEAGQLVRPTEWSAFTRHYRGLIRDADVVVLSGSLPPGLPINAYAVLISLAAAAGVATVLDTSGPALRAALPAGPDVIKPNAVELAEITGRSELVEAVPELRALGARAVVVSCGAEGLYATTSRSGWRAAPPERLAGNPTGAGDACVAALARGLASGTPWPDMLREAVALSAAAVPCLAAGDFDADVYQRFRTAVQVEETDDAHIHP